MEVSEIKSEFEKMNKAFEEFKSTNDAAIKELRDGRPDPLTEDKLAKIDKSIEAYEDINQKLTKRLEEEKASDDAETKWKGELDTKLAEIETTLDKIHQSESGTVEEKKSKHFNDWAQVAVKAIQMGHFNLSEDEKKKIDDVVQEYKSLGFENKNLNMGTSTEGGYLAPVEMVRDIIKNVIEISPVRELAKVRET